MEDAAFQMLQKGLDEIKAEIAGMRTQLHTVVRLETEYAHTKDAISRAFTELGKHDVRLDALEAKPGQSMSKGLTRIIEGAILLVILATVAYVFPTAVHVTFQTAAPPAATVVK